MAALLHTEARLLIRDPATLLFGIALPVVILAVIGLAPGTGDADPELNGLRAIDTYVPTLALFAFTILAISAMPSVLADYRDKGVLRRLATTPVSPVRLLSAQVVVTTIAALFTVVLVVIVGRAAFEVPLPDPFGGFVVALALGGAALLALGLTIAAVAPRARIANGIGMALFFPLMFFGGLWVPREAMGDALLTISDLTPVGAAVGALQDVTTGGSWPDVGHLAVLVVWTVVASVLAARLFRWD